MVACACGWVGQGEEDRVVEATQVHSRQIHGVEISRERVLVSAQPA